ncbi:MAG: hypothetical protein KH135_00690 [Firmicutes bacterium]|nr:hypothetical protein [Bacillota bacterium]
MKLYAIKRNGYDIPYKVSYRQNVGLYSTLEGCKRALVAEKRYCHNFNPNDYEILEYDFDFNNYKVIKC